MVLQVNEDLAGVRVRRAPRAQLVEINIDATDVGRVLREPSELLVRHCAELCIDLRMFAEDHDVHA